MFTANKKLTADCNDHVVYEVILGPVTKLLKFRDVHLCSSSVTTASQ
jgi:hypothetical protein